MYGGTIKLKTHTFFTPVFHFLPVWPENSGNDFERFRENCKNPASLWNPGVPLVIIPQPYAGFWAWRPELALQHEIRAVLHDHWRTQLPHLGRAGNRNHSGYWNFGDLMNHNSTAYNSESGLRKCCFCSQCPPAMPELLRIRAMHTLPR